MLTGMERQRRIAMNGPLLTKESPGRAPRLARELATVRAMVAMYCRDVHGRGQAPCAECAELIAYATRRVDRCVFGRDKPTCANCNVHCYNDAMRERVRGVMRHAGPRMLTRHPLLAIHHVIDGRRPSPELPQPHRERPVRFAPQPSQPTASAQASRR